MCSNRTPHESFPQGRKTAASLGEFGDQRGLEIARAAGKDKSCKFFVVAQFSEFVKCSFLVKKLEHKQ